MGVTSFSLGVLKGLIQSRNIRTVLELGSQNNYAQPVGYPNAPYMREWYEAQNIHYESIDLNGEAGSHKLDLSRQFAHGYTGAPIRPIIVAGPSEDPTIFYESDMVTDFGTSEHVSAGNIFDIEKLYNCWVNKINLCKIGGIIYSQNPESGSWPGHGAFYYTEDFYYGLQQLSDLKIYLAGRNAAMNNITDGWEIYAIMEKTGLKFPTLQEFKALDIRNK